MSKLGKKPILIPKETKVKIESGKLILTGPKGSKELNINEKIFSASISESNNLVLKLIKKNESSNIIWGTTRSIINSAIIGVTSGHEKTLEITGVGFRANLKGDTLNLQLGFSHDINYPIPDGIDIKCESQTTIQVSGPNKQEVGQVAAEIRGFRKPEPYKGKGIRYRDEQILRKEGKKK